MKNITEYTYENTSFNGFRVCKQYKGVNFVKYYSVKEYGSYSKARKAAKKGLENLNERLATVRLRKGKMTIAGTERCRKAMNV